MYICIWSQSRARKWRWSVGCPANRHAYCFNRYIVSHVVHKRRDTAAPDNTRSHTVVSVNAGIRIFGVAAMYKRNIYHRSASTGNVFLSLCSAWPAFFRSYFRVSAWTWNAIHRLLMPKRARGLIVVHGAMGHKYRDHVEEGRHIWRTWWV